MEKFLEENVLKKLNRKIMMVVVFCQSFGGMGLAAGVTVGALIVSEIIGNDSLAGFPSAILTFGSAFAAYMIGKISQKKVEDWGSAKVSF